MKQKVTNILKEHSFLSIMTIITFLISLFFLYVTYGESWSYRYIIVLLGAFPFFLYLLFTILSIKFSDKHIIKIIILILASIEMFFLLGYYFAIIIASGFIIDEHPIKNIKYYNHYIKSEYLLQAFPSEVPKNKENIEFVYAPGLLQASTIYSLYYVDNDLSIEEFDNKYMEKSEWIGYMKEYGEKKGLLSGTFNNTPITYQECKNFKVYLIDSYCDDSGYCNHGEFLLVAVNENTKEVIYRAESW